MSEKTDYERDHLTEESADLRINAQKQEEFYVKQADFVINGENKLMKYTAVQTIFLFKLTGGE